MLAGVLLYLALRGVDLQAVVEALRTADYRWLAPLVAVVFLSHLLRAWRWQVLLEALPADEFETSTRRVSLKMAFYSTMIGYMVNYAAPRLGELARAGNMATQERLSFSGVFGTVVAERILDIVVLVLALASAFILFLDRLGVLNDLFIEPALRQLDALPAIALLIGTVVLIVLVALIYYQTLHWEGSIWHSLWHERVRPVLASFTDGLRTLLRARRRGVILFSTVAMWACYTIMAYLPLVMLGMIEDYNLSLVDTWGLMVFGTLGVVVPTPGGTGSYHYITIQTLVELFSVPHAPATTYAVLTHGAQLVLYVLVGGLCLLLQGSSMRALRRSTQAAEKQTNASQDS